jgi:hypothetical protein
MLDKILILDYTVQDALLAAGIGVGILILFSVLKKVFRAEKVKPYMQTVRCSDCGWQGQVSRHAGRCPGCNKPLGDRTINRQSSNAESSTT